MVRLHRQPEIAGYTLQPTMPQPPAALATDSSPGMPSPGRVKGRPISAHHSARCPESPPADTDGMRIKAGIDGVGPSRRRDGNHPARERLCLARPSLRPGLCPNLPLQRQPPPSPPGKSASLFLCSACCWLCWWEWLWEPLPSFAGVASHRRAAAAKRRNPALTSGTTSHG